MSPPCGHHPSPLYQAPALLWRSFTPLLSPKPLHASPGLASLSSPLPGLLFSSSFSKGSSFSGMPSSAEGKRMWEKPGLQNTLLGTSRDMTSLLAPSRHSKNFTDKILLRFNKKIFLSSLSLETSPGTASLKQALLSYNLELLVSGISAGPYDIQGCEGKEGSSCSTGTCRAAQVHTASSCRTSAVQIGGAAGSKP